MIFLFILSIFQICVAQLILDKLPSSCNYLLNGKSISVFGEIWNITRFRKHYIFSLCEPISTPHCDSGAFACVHDARHPKDSVSNAGTSFEIFQIQDEKKTKDVLKSSNGFTCSGGLYGNYTFIIEIDMSHAATAKYQLIDATDCEFHLRINPNFELPCTSNVNGQLVSLQHFKNEEFIIGDDDTKFAVSLCGAAPSCKNSTITACKLHGNQITPIGDLNSQHVVYNVEELDVRSHFGLDKRFRLFTEIKIKCNWKARRGSSKYIKPMTQGVNYKFQLESSAACVKMPMNCMTRDGDNYSYDLKKLYKPNGSWNVRNVPRGTLHINICGPLETTKNCDNYSQVCHVWQQNVLNYGSILSNLRIAGESLRAQFIAGDTCPSNSTMLLSTNLLFKCMSVEKGPVLEKINNCSYEILWETPQACPKYLSQGSDCLVRDLLGTRDLKQLNSAADRKHVLSRNVFLFYNFCGDLQRTCNNFRGVSLCLVQNKKEYVVGWTNKEIASEDGSLSMKLKGEKHGNWFRNATVLFRCNYASRQEGTIYVKIIRENSAYEITVFTPLACASRQTVDCQAWDGMAYYDLTSLSSASQNKIIKVGQLEYILNICRPLINDADALCRTVNVSSCLRNATEANLKKRYFSLGTLQAPTVKNQKLFVKYTGGEFCLRGLDYWSTVIRFECASGESEPKFVTETDCSYEFVWKTKAACARRLRTRSPEICVLQDRISGRKFDFSRSNHTSLSFVDENDTVFNFDICNDSYKVKINSNDTFLTEMSETKFEQQHTHYILTYTLKETCLSKHTNLQLQINFKCADNSKENFKFVSFNNCIINFVFESAIICTLEDLFPQDAASLKSNNQNNCLVANDFASFNLSSIKPFTVTSASTGTKYAVGLKEGACNSLICRNSTELVNSCPGVQYVGEDSLVKLKFASMQQCDGGYLNTQLWLKCNSSLESPRVVKESRCQVHLEYPTNVACNLLQIVPIPRTSNTALIASICSIIFVVLLVITGFALWYRKRKHYNCISKTHVPVYCRNSQD